MKILQNIYSTTHLLYSKKDIFLSSFYIFFACIIIILQFSLVIFSNVFPLFLVNIINGFTIFFCFFSISYAIYQSRKSKNLFRNLEESTSYNKSLKTLHDNLSAFKHDFNNIVQAIGGYIINQDMEGLNIYYSQLLQDCQSSNSLYALSPDVINNPAIHSILVSKYNKAEELGIHVSIDIFLDLNKLNMKIYEFSRILGILMDNAIEAASECEEKLIHVEIRKDSLNGCQLLIIENTYFEENIDLKRIFEKGFSSKSHNTGLGLWEVNQILKKNKNLSLHTIQDKQFFRQQLELYNTFEQKKGQHLVKTQ